MAGLASSSSGEHFGAVNGWCNAVKLPSSFSSNIGKSTTHIGAHSHVCRLKSLPTLIRSAPRASLTILALSAPKKTISPSTAPTRSRITFRLASGMFLTIGDCRPSTPLARSLTLM
ncbi:hypothetical protein D9M71_619750 [compost metagenome]